jgi:hypothetical protein
MSEALKIIHCPEPAGVGVKVTRAQEVKAEVGIKLFAAIKVVVRCIACAGN